MNSVKLVITALIIFLVGACTQNKLAKDPNLYAVPVNNFSKSVELLISNADFLEEEVMKINAQSPSVHPGVMVSSTIHEPEVGTK